MTTLQRQRRMGLASFLLLAAAGLIALLLGPLSAPYQGQESLIVGTALLVGAAGLGGATLWANRRRRADFRIASRYSCPRCGAAPPPAEEHTAESIHCGLCGQPVMPVEDQRISRDKVSRDRHLNWRGAPGPTGRSTAPLHGTSGTDTTRAKRFQGQAG